MTVQEIPEVQVLDRIQNDQQHTVEVCSGTSGQEAIAENSQGNRTKESPRSTVLLMAVHRPCTTLRRHYNTVDPSDSGLMKPW